MIEDRHNSSQSSESNYETNVTLEENIGLNENIQHLKLPELSKGAKKCFQDNSVLTTEADSDGSIYSSGNSATILSDEEIQEIGNEPAEVMERRHKSLLK